MEKNLRRPSKRIDARKVKTLVVSVATCAALVLTLTQRERFDHLIEAGRSRISQMMRLEQVEWEEVGVSNLSQRVTKDALMAASKLKVGQEMLPIDLSEIETRLMSIPWLESVQIQKKLPSTMLVRYTVHSARALGIRHGRLWSISDTGRWIAPLDSGPKSGGAALDLPVLVNEDEIAAGLEWLEALETTLGAQLTQIHEVNMTQERGSDRVKATALVELQYSSQTAKLSIVGPSNLTPESLNRLKHVVQYLIKNNVLVSNVDLRLGKKVVVNVGKRP